MGGAHCKHENFDVLQEDSEEFQEGLFTFKCGQLKCQDCLQESRGIKWKGIITKHSYGGWKPVIKSECSHKVYYIDNDSIKIMKEQTLAGSFARLFMGPAMDGIQYHSYLHRDAVCRKCLTNWPVRAEFQKEWEKGVIVNKRTTDWKKIEVDQK